MTFSVQTGVWAEALLKGQFTQKGNPFVLSGGNVCFHLSCRRLLAASRCYKRAERDVTHMCKKGKINVMGFFYSGVN